MDVFEELQRWMSELGLDYSELLRITRVVICAEGHYAKDAFKGATSDMHPDERHLHEMRAIVFDAAWVALGQIIAEKEASEDDSNNAE